MMVFFFGHSRHTSDDMVFVEVVFAEPWDVGFGALRRRRGFNFFVRKDIGAFTCDPQQVYDRLARDLKKKQIRISDLVWASDAQVRKEVEMLCKGNKSSERSVESVLTKFEQDNLKKYEVLMDDAGLDLENQICVPGQNPDHVAKWSNKSKLPTLTATDKLLWVRKLRRPLCAVEKFAGHGFPVRKDLADSLGVPVSSLSRQWFRETVAYMSFYAFLRNPEYLCPMSLAGTK